MGSKTSSQTNQSQATYALPQSSAAYDTVLGKATTAANTPYQAYTGELTAGFNGQEQAATGALNSLGSLANGYFGGAAQQSGLGALAVNPSALNGAAISQYESPYQSDVINATQAQIANQDAIQNQQQTSNAIGSGAFGGDRAGVAQAALAGQQALANNSTLAGLNNQNYSQALATAQQQQGLGLSADQANRAAVQQNAQLLAGLGSASSSAGLGIANAQLGAGALQQQTRQAADTANYGQFEQAQAFPYQQAQFLAGITDATAPLYGSTSTGQSTTQTSGLNSILGGLLGVAGLAGKASSPYSFARGGSVDAGLGALHRPVLGGLRGEDGLAFIAAHPHFPRTMRDIGEADRSAIRHDDRPHLRATGGVVGDGRGFAALLDSDPRLNEDLGRLRPRASGGSSGSPYADSQSYIPGVAIQAARMPTAPNLFGNQGGGQSASQQMQQGAAIGKGLAGLGSTLGNSGFGQSVSNGLGSMFGGGSNSYGLPFARGGLVGNRPGYDAGGTIGMDALAFDPGALNAPPPPPDDPTSQGLGALAQSAPDGTLGSLGKSAPPSSAPGAAVTFPAPKSVTSTGLGALADGVAAKASDTSGLGAIDKAAPSSASPLGGYNGRVAAIESSNGATSPNLYQFQPGTWKGMVAQHPELGLTSDGVNDPGQQERAMNALTADNTAALTKGLGRMPTQPEMYLAHQQGAQGALDLLANPDAKAADIVGTKAITGNGGTADMTAGQFASMWSAKFNGAKVAPTSALSYSGQGSSGLGALAPSDPAPTGGLAGNAPRSFSDYFSPMLGGTGQPSPGHSSSLFPGISDRAFDLMASLGANMAASPSKSFGVALGQGLQGAVKSDQAQQALQREAANTRSEIGNRTALQGVERSKIEVAQQELQARLKQIAGELGNYKSEDTYRQGEIANRNLQVALQRYELLPGPDGQFRYLDKANPGRGLLTGDQVPELSAAGRAMTPPMPAGASGAPASPPATGGINPTDPGGGRPAGGVPGVAPSTGSVGGMSGAGPTLNGPSALGSSDFQKTGRPTLAAPQNFLPTNYWGDNLRRRNDPVSREAAAVKTREDVTSATQDAQKAQSARFYSDEMDRRMDELDRSGLLKPGAGFHGREELAKNYNLAAGALGLPAVDEKAVGTGEALIKDQTRLAGQLTATLGSREAASIYSSMMGATPGPTNTTAGYRGISASLRTLGQRQIDRGQFMEDYAQRYGSTGEADAAFNRLNPPEMYAQQAKALAAIPQAKVEQLRADAHDLRYASAFDQKYGAGLSRYFLGGQ